MIAAIIGLVLGILIGFYIPFTYPDSYTLYISVGILASLDSVFGAIRASLEGKYNNSIFITGFFTNAILAGFLAYLGDKLGVPLDDAESMTSLHVAMMVQDARRRRESPAPSG